VDSTNSDQASRLAQELGDSIQRSLAASPQIALSLSRIKAAGYEVSLVLEATVSFHRRGGAQRAEISGFDLRVERAEPASLKMTPLDRKFLRSLKISVEDDE